MDNVQSAEGFLLCLSFALALLYVNSQIRDSDDSLISGLVKFASFIVMVVFLFLAGIIAIQYYWHMKV